MVAALLWIAADPAEVVSHVVYEHLLSPHRRDLFRRLIMQGRHRRSVLRRLPTRGCRVGLLALPVVLTLLLLLHLLHLHLHLLLHLLMLHLLHLLHLHLLHHLHLHLHRPRAA